MKDKKKISALQLKRLVTICFIGTSVLSIPSNLAAYSNQDAWIAATLGVLWGLILVWLYTSLANHMDNMNLMEYINELLGKWLGTFISILLFLFFFINCSTLVYILGNFVSNQLMQETPIEITNLIFVIVLVIGARLGLETFSRLAEILYIFGYFLFGLVVICVLKDINFENIQPFFESGLKPNIRGSLLFSVFTSISLLLPLMMIFPANVNNIKRAKKSIFIGILEGGINLILITLLCILVLGPDATARYSYPTFIFAKKINIAKIIQRFEASASTLWFITLFFKSVLYYYVSALSLGQILKLKDYRITTIPLGMILVMLSLIVYPNSVYLNKWDTTTWVFIAITFGVIFPLILLIISKLKSKFNND